MSVPAPRNAVEDIHCTSASDLLDALSPRGALWTPNPRAWIFRGHASAEWKLHPSALRQPNAFAKYGVVDKPLYPGASVSSGPAWSVRADRQTLMLDAFRRGLDQSGLVIPSRSPRVHPHELNEGSTNAEPIPEAFPLMAFAQHHGLPTLLLDWTKRAIVGAYFAAVEAAETRWQDAGGHLAIWALFRNPTVAVGVYRPNPYFYEAPAGTNPNLAAQQGLFTLLTSDGDISLEEHYAQCAARPNEPMLRRLLLPVAEAPRLLRFLSYEGVTGASMFPGPNGVVKAMQEVTLWDRRDA